MHPSLTGILPEQEADALDERYEQLEYIQQEDNETETTSARVQPRTPHIVPKIAPPKIVRRYDTNELPETGTWVVVTVQHGNRKETLQGRVTVADTSRIRLRQGAGWWEIPTNTIVGITAGDDPAHRTR